MIQTIHTKDAILCFNSSLLTEPIEVVFDAHYWQENKLIIGSAQGRGTTWFVKLNKLHGALRHYRRGGLFGKLVKDHYFYTGWENTRSIAEFNLLTALHGAGVNVPRPIAAKATKRGLTYQADLLSEKIPAAQDLVALLTKTALPAMLYQKIGEQIKKMHDTQVNHTDLNIHNILIDAQDKIWIIDFDKCTKQRGNRWKVANLNRLARSFKKEQKKKKINWNESDWQYLLEGYKK